MTKVNIIEIVTSNYYLDRITSTKLVLLHLIELKIFRYTLRIKKPNTILCLVLLLVAGTGLEPVTFGL